MAGRLNLLLLPLLLTANLPFGRPVDDSPFMGDQPDFHSILIENPRDTEMEIDCRGYYNHELDKDWWHAHYVLGAYQFANMTFSKIKHLEVYEIYCSYYDRNKCWAHWFRIFVHPSSDSYYCTNEFGGCRYTFEDNGEVITRYGVDKDTIGVVPTSQDVAKKCLWFLCIPKFWIRKIGQSCCGRTCKGWEEGM